MARSTIRRKLAALASLFDHLLETTRLAVASNILERRGMEHLLAQRKGGKVHYLPLHAMTGERMHA